MLGSAAGSTSAAAPRTAVVYVVTDEPDALFERAAVAGAEVVAGLADEDYGSRGFTIRDPEGGHGRSARTGEQQRADPAPAVAGAPPRRRDCRPDDRGSVGVADSGGEVSGWYRGRHGAGREVGVGALIALENLFPPIPSEAILPLAGFRAAAGGINPFSPGWPPPSAPSSGR